jgi:hypothetical protein
VQANCPSGFLPLFRSALCDTSHAAGGPELARWSAYTMRAAIVVRTRVPPRLAVRRRRHPLLAYPIIQRALHDRSIGPTAFERTSLLSPPRQSHRGLGQRSRCTGELPVRFEIVLSLATQCFGHISRNSQAPAFLQRAQVQSHARNLSRAEGRERANAFRVGAVVRIARASWVSVVRCPQ